MKISRGLHILVILTFFLPFFYTGCGPTPEEKAAIEKAKSDSIANAQKVISDSSINKNQADTITHISENNSLSNQNNVESNTKETEKQISDELVEKYPWLRILLKPSEDTYTGFGAVLNSIVWIQFFSLSLSFVLIIIGITIKFCSSNSMLTTCIVEISSLILLLIAKSPSWITERLYGYWTCVIISSLLILYDLFILINSMHKHNKGLIMRQ